MNNRTVNRYLYRAADFRAIDRNMIENFSVAGIELMERAGASALDLIGERWPNARTLSVVCGGGNNGGDGYIVARLAHERGWDVRAFPIIPPEQLQGDARIALERFLSVGGAILDYLPEDLEGPEVLVDALLGTGLDRPVSGTFAGVIQAVNRYRNRTASRQRQQRAVVALDIPSGLNADTGAIMGHAVKADLTVSFIGLKCGLFTGEGPEHAGEIQLSDLDIDPKARDIAQPLARLLPPPFTTLPRRTRSAHKGLYGHVLLVGGNRGYSGAVRLAAEAAARVGAGLVSVATHPDHAAWLNVSCPEIMCQGMENSQDLAPLLKRATVVAIGPGLGQDNWARDLLRQVMESRLPMVVDADALNLLGQLPGERDNWILTPHPGEAGRLLGVANEAIQSDRFLAINQLQEKFGGVIVLKGAGTLIKAGADIPDVCMAGNPGMASGGMGDVLTGVIAGLLAQKSEPAEAARLGVCLHGQAGDLAAREGERGLLASDLMQWLRLLVNGLAA